MKRVLLFCFSILSVSALIGQSAPNFFQEITYSQVFLAENLETVTAPDDHILFSLDYNAMVNHLRTAPSEGSPGAIEAAIQVEIPMADGSWETFKVWESTPMHPELAAKYPMIKGFSGVGVTNPHHTIKLGYSPAGFTAFIPSENGGSTVSRLAFGQTQYYYCFALDKVNIPNALVEKVEMEGEPLDETPIIEDQPLSFRGGGDGALVERRDYRFALACTGEYGASHGGTVEAALGTLMDATNILNSVLERDADMRLFLIPTNDNLVFINPDTDPYNNSNNGGALLGQNEDVLNGIVGLPSFDVGHVFTNGCTDVGGVVSGSVCSAGKARGVTCHSNGSVAGITISIAAHEMGHQLDVGHTWNRCGGGSPGQFHSDSAVEPGSGSTIVSYKGLCGSDNISGPANIHYSNGSIQEFWTYTHFGGGNFCPLVQTTSNHHPVVTVDYPTGFYIPLNTPFELTGEATDEDGDALTYAWEQMNLGPSVPLGSPVASSPSFRVFDPKTTPRRVFPKLQTVLNNSLDPEERLPTYTRPLDFRLVVRDNNVTEGAGGITWQDVSFQATESAGPFRVTYPNTNSVVWKAGEEVEITWNVANTDNDLVKCNAVNILLSTDGGFTFPHLVSSSSPNDGAEFITVPELISTSVRVRIEAANNIFFDLSNFNFSIEPADEPGYAMLLDPQWQQVCVPNNGVVDIAVSSILNYDEPVEFAIIGGLPADVDVNFSDNPVMPGESTTLSVDMTSVVDDGTFEAELRAISGLDTTYRTIVFAITYSDFTGVELSGPENGASNLGLLGTFEWVDLPQADFYDIQVATSPTFEASTIVDEQNNIVVGTYTSDVALEPSTIYYWRVRPSNECVVAPYSSPSVFQTFNASCDQYESADVPQTISSQGLPIVESTLTVLESGVISDLNITNIKGNHDALPDLKVSLTNPIGEELVLFSDICGNISEFNFGLDDESPFEIECPPLDGLKYIPQNELSFFDGDNIIGNWTLTLEVINTLGDGGELKNWGIEFCAAIEAQHPTLVEHDTLFVKPLEVGIIHNYQLFASDPDNIGNDLIFTVVDPTDHGYISKNGVQLNPGETFKLVDINAEAITYTNTNGDEVYDFFTFHVTDGNGGLLGTPRFNIVIDENALTDVGEELLANQVMLYPNPATSNLTVAFKQLLDSDASLMVSDAQGRLVAEREMNQADRQMNFDLSNYADGIYFLTVKTQSGVFAKKFIVQK